MALPTFLPPLVYLCNSPLPFFHRPPSLRGCHGYLGHSVTTLHLLFLEYLELRNRVVNHMAFYQITIEQVQKINSSVNNNLFIFFFKKSFPFVLEAVLLFFFLASEIYPL